MVSTGTVRGFGAMPVREVSLSAPWHWLDRGYEDMRKCAPHSFVYGVAITVASWLLTGGLWSLGLEAWILALAGGFLLLAPLLAMGLYNLSRQAEAGEPPARNALFMVEPGQRLQFVYFGFLLAFIYLVWLRVAMLLYALLAYNNFMPIEDFTTFALTTGEGLTLLVVGSAIGGAIAFGGFALSAVSAPMLLAQRVDLATAVLTSLEAVRRNFLPLLLWAWLIALLIAVGIATAFFGLIVIFPLIGHATWHAYRDLVVSSG